MSKLLLIDGAHRQETRVAILDNGRVEDFDYEVAGSEQLRGNIYLAKIARVEPSLQAAFVDYGGNRHGFLAFDQIHPDYYNLTKEDRDKLLEEAAAEAALQDPDSIDDEDDNETEDEPSDGAMPVEKVTIALDEAEQGALVTPQNDRRRPNRLPMHKRYKIQDVISRRQIILVQVVKEERGNKGAALSSYLSLAGRFSVLMPNTPRGGGISRKIANTSDRKRLRDIVGSLEISKGMGLIVRTAGAKKSKVDIVRDYDYLTQAWDRIRDKTMKSMAPSLVHQEGSLTFRAIRDLFDKSMEQVLISGDEAYKTALELAELVMPGQTDKIKQWQDDSPLFHAKGAESQLESVYTPTVELPSGGYLVINQTEALVAIDVNSGKSTKQKSIEDTALSTNLEAAAEACRQMRLRDLAGLVVIDFIDMEENRNNRAVEKKVADGLQRDRARVQHSRISQFGLMEISRQRRRAGVINTASEPCQHCEGTGRVRASSMSALQLLRALDKAAPPESGVHLKVSAPVETLLYLLNNNRDALSDIEYRANAKFDINPDSALASGKFEITTVSEKDSPPARQHQSRHRGARPEKQEVVEALVSPIESEPQPKPESTGRRRRKRRGDRDDSNTETQSAPNTVEASSNSPEAHSPENDDDANPTRKRRRRRKKRERPISFEVQVDVENLEYEIDPQRVEDVTKDVVAPDTPPVAEPEALAAEVAHAPSEPSEPKAESVETAEAKPPKTPKARKPRASKAKPKAASPTEAEPEKTPPAVQEKPEPIVIEVEAEQLTQKIETPSTNDDQPKRRGWWSS